jgi:flagellar biosynthesis chaperone FliJ
MANTTIDEREAKLLKQLEELRVRKTERVKTRSQKLQDQIRSIDERIAKLNVKKDELSLELDELAAASVEDSSFTAVPAEEV